MGFNKLTNLFPLVFLFIEMSQIKLTEGVDVWFYEHYHYGGRPARHLVMHNSKYECVNVGHPWNEIISVVRVKNGCAKFYQSENCGGGWEKQVFDSDYDLEYGTENDKIVSVSNCAPKKEIRGTVELYEHNGWDNGITKTISVHKDECITFHEPYQSIVSAAQVTFGCVELWIGTDCRGSFPYILTVHDDWRGLGWIYDNAFTSVSDCPYWD